MDYSELLNSKSEHLTVKSEDLKVTYKQGRTFKKTRVLPKDTNTKIFKITKGGGY